MRSKLMILLATSAMIGLITPSAEAFQLKINGSTVFLATHEGTSVGVSPAAGDPDTGTYNVMEQETTFIYSSDALYGNRSIDISSAARGQLGVEGLNTSIGDVLEVSGAIKNEGDQYFGIRFAANGIYNGHGGGIRIGPGTVIFVGDPGGPWGGAWEEANSAMVQFSGGTRTETIRTGLTATDWHTYVFTHTVGSTTMSVNIDGIVSIEGSFEPEHDPETPNAGDAIINGVWMIDPYNASGPMHFDAMPEPASLALLGAGGLLLLSRRRRKA